MRYDVFISHASEDKDDFVRLLANTLRSHHVEVWYDEFSLRPGDGLRKSIDHGLAQSRYGIVVLSPSFFGKAWPEWELNGIVARHLSGADAVLLPVWHNVSKSVVEEYSPSLADVVAVPSNIGVEAVALRLLDVVKPTGSTLVIARGIVMEHGGNPPVVTDDWWLDAVELSGANAEEGSFQEAMGWGWWGFPLPEKGETPEQRGSRVAWAAMQMEWQLAATRARLSQLSHPDIVHTYIESQPGLLTTCHDFPHYLIAYAPQLAIRGFSGPFEGILDEMLARTVAKRREARASSSQSGAALTVDGKPPLCDALLAVRHPKYGNFRPDMVASSFFAGDVLGPPTKVLEHIEYVALLLSAQSDWMPQRLRSYLIRGMKEWAVWNWIDYDPDLNRSGIHDGSSLLWRDLLASADRGKLSLTADALTELQAKLSSAALLCNLPESAATLLERFLGEGFIDEWIARQHRPQRKSKKKRKARRKAQQEATRMRRADTGG